MAARKSAAITFRSPPYIHTDELADLLNAVTSTNAWDAQKARRWLKRVGAGEKVGGRFVTTKQGLREAFPAMWEEILRWLPEDRA